MISYLKRKLKFYISSIVKNEIGIFKKEGLIGKENYYRSKYQLSESFRFGRLEDIYLSGNNIKIGDHTYINSGSIQSGNNSIVKIGEWCAIGYNVNIIAVTHDVLKPTGPAESRRVIEKDIVIGDRCWIGTNVFIKEGVSIGNDVIIGANSVVVKDVKDKAIIGGVPAKIIRFKNSDEVN